MNLYYFYFAIKYFFHSSDIALELSFESTFAGTPPITEFAGTSSITRLFAPMTELSPTFIRPIITVPGKIITLFPKDGQPALGPEKDLPSVTH